MEKWLFDLWLEFMKLVYGSYLSRIDYIIMLYIVVLYNEVLLSINVDKLDDLF